jgi:hypothetical protein
MSNKRVIYKYKLAITDRQTIEVPRNSVLLTVGIQVDELVAWVDTPAGPEADLKVKWDFIIRGTGNEFDLDEEPRGIYMTSLQLGDFVWHVYLALG